MKFEITEEKAKEIIDFMKVSKANLQNFISKSTQPIVKPSELKISATDIFQWSKKGLISLSPPGEGKKRNWAKLNLSEVIWLKMVESLRNVGFPFKDIKQFNKSFHKNLFTDFGGFKEGVLKAFEGKKMNKELLEDIKILTDFLVENPSSNENNIQIFSNLLGVMLAEVLLYRSKINVLIYFKPGKVINEVGEEEKYNYLIVPEGFQFSKVPQKIIDEAKKHPHFNICINELIAEFVGSEINEGFAEEFGLINENEKEVINAIRDGEVKEILIKKDQQENLTMTTTGKGELSNEKVQLIKQILRMNEYDEVRVVFRNDKNIYLENKIKRKL